MPIYCHKSKRGASVLTADETQQRSGFSAESRTLD
jgi:hypothetical protein